MIELNKIIAEKVSISFNLIGTGLFEDEVTGSGVKMTPLLRSVVEISVGCRRNPTVFHKKADRPIVKNGKKADMLLHKVVKYLTSCK